MIEDLEVLFGRILRSRGYELPQGGRVLGRHDLDYLAAALADVAEARVEMARGEGHDQGWLDAEEFYGLDKDHG